MRSLYRLLLFRLRNQRWKRWGLLTLMIGATGILLVGLTAWQNPTVNQITLYVGDFAPFDIVAPQQFTYESAVLTERERQRASEKVGDQYHFDENTPRRTQSARLRAVLEQITTIRAGATGNKSQAVQALSAINELSVTQQSALAILNLPAELWTTVTAEAPLVLDRMMREDIREATLALARQRVSMMISSGMDESASDVVALLVRAFLIPNSLYDDARTQELRLAARNSVPPQMRTLGRGETIVRVGARVDADAAEALAQLKLIQQQWDRWLISRALCFAAVILAVLIIGIARLRPSTIHNYQEMALLVLTGALWLLAARLMNGSYPWLPYLYPLAALSMLTSVLLDERIAVLVTITFALVAHFFNGINPVLVIYLTAGSLIGALSIERAERLNSFWWAGALVAVTNVVALLAFRTSPDAAATPLRFAQLAGLALLNGLLSSGLALVGYFLLGNLFGITTSLQLNELSRPTHPLLRQLQLKAPGTYFHTILVSNMAERAAAAIGADALLTRVGAYYHDIGKTVRPYFFTENILDGPSPHERLDPNVSAQIIISHVTDGLSLAQKYHLPERLQEFIREHHGRSLVRYFYARAVNDQSAGETLDEAGFRYPGPNPRSKETAILMLADICEATVRARHPANRDELTSIIHQSIGERTAAGELNDSNLTLSELQTIRDVFVQVLEGVHHPRINYPEINKAPAPSTDSTPISNGNSAPSNNGNEEKSAVVAEPVLNGVELPSEVIVATAEKRRAVPLDEMA